MLFTVNYSLNGKMQMCARYLGAWIHILHTNAVEVDKRIRAAEVGWLAMGKYWKSNALLSQK